MYIKLKDRIRDSIGIYSEKRYRRIWKFKSDISCLYIDVFCVNTVGST